MTSISSEKAFIDVDELKRRVKVSEVVSLRVKLTTRGKEFVGLSPFTNERTPSFTVNDGRGFWHCFSSGQSGDQVSFLMKTFALDFKAAVVELALIAGGDIPRIANPRPARRDRIRHVVEDEEARRDAARRLYQVAVPAPHTVVETYLREARCIDLDAIAAMYGYERGIPPTLRIIHSFQQREQMADGRWETVWSGPVMVAPVQGRQGSVIAVHITMLAPDGSDKADRGDRPSKIIRGPYSGGAIRMARVADHIGVSEGIESGLTVMGACARHNILMPVWAAGSLGNLTGAGTGRGDPHPDMEGKYLPSAAPDWQRPGFLPPAMVRSITVLADADARDQHANRAMITRGVRKFQRHGCETREAWPAPGTDFNDMAKAAATRDEP